MSLQEKINKLIADVYALAETMIEKDPETRNFLADGESIIVLGHIKRAIEKITATGPNLTDKESKLLNIYRQAGVALYTNLGEGFFDDKQYFEPGTEKKLRSALGLQPRGKPA